MKKTRDSGFLSLFFYAALCLLFSSLFFLTDLQAHTERASKEIFLDGEKRFWLYWFWVKTSFNDAQARSLNFNR